MIAGKFDILEKKILLLNFTQDQHEEKTNLTSARYAKFIFKLDLESTLINIKNWSLHRIYI